MVKFLTRRSRSSLGLLLLLGALLFLVGIILTHLKGITQDSLVYNIGMGIWFAVIVLLGGLAVYLGRGVTSLDLSEASAIQLAEEKRTIEAWSKVELKYSSFRELSKKDKVLYIFLVGFGSIAILYGLLDFLGFVLPMKIPVENSFKTVPTWLSGLMEILIGAVVVLCLPLIIRLKLVERTEYLLQRLKREGKVIFFPRRPKLH